MQNGVAPSGLQIRVDGVVDTTAVTFAWRPGEQHTLSGPSSFTLTGTEQKFRGWHRHPGGTSPDLTIHAPSNNSPQTWTAFFTTRALSGTQNP